MNNSEAKRRDLSPDESIFLGRKSNFFGEGLAWGVWVGVGSRILWSVKFRREMVWVLVWSCFRIFWAVRK